MRRNFIFVMALMLSVSMGGQTLSLDSCFALARRNSYAIKTAKLDVEEAEEVKAQALTKYFPQVAASAIGYRAFSPLIELTTEDISDPNVRSTLDRIYQEIGGLVDIPNSITMMSRGIMAQIGAVQPIYLGGRVVNGNKLAKVGVDAAKLKEQVAERDALLAVEESYWLVIDLEAKRQTVETVRSLLDTIHIIVGAAVKAGLAMPNDMLQVELRKNELAAQRIRLDNGITLARQALCQSIGLEYDERLKLDTLEDYSSVQGLVDLKTAVEQRPEFSLLEVQIKAEKLKRKMTLAEALPTVLFGVSYGYANYLSPFNQTAEYQFKEMDQTRFFNGLVGLTVTVPITGWWETSHKLKQNEIKIKQAELQRDEYAEKMRLQTMQAFNSTVETAALVKQYSSSVVTASENLRITEVNYRSGMQTVADLLQAQALYLQAQNGLIDARVEYRMAVKRYDAYVMAR